MFPRSIFNLTNNSIDPRRVIFRNQVYNTFDNTDA